MPPIVLAALLVQAAAPPPQSDDGPPIVVRAPLKATEQTPATMVAEPVAMMIAAFDGEGDAERDGYVDRSEMNASVRRSFEAIDTAKSGALRYLAFADWATRWLGSPAALPSPFEVDRNADDQITETELEDHFSRLFARYDRDGDRRISRAELLTYRTAPIGANGPPGRGDRPGGPGAKPPGPPPKR